MKRSIQYATEIFVTLRVDKSVSSFSNSFATKLDEFPLASSLRAYPLDQQLLAQLLEKVVDLTTSQSWECLFELFDSGLLEALKRLEQQRLVCRAIQASLSRVRTPSAEKSVKTTRE
jgi:hypothetical protein